MYAVHSRGSDDGGLLLRLFRGALGTSVSAVSDSGRSHCFFSWGEGGGEEEAPGVLLSRFRRTTRAFKQPHFLYYILYIEQWRFHCCMLQVIAKSTLDLDALGSARALFRLRQPVDLVYASIYVKGLLLLVPPPRSGGYDV
jgi:hypothetical protein